MLSVWLLAFAPAVALGIYLYIRDKYEKEPLGMIMLSLIGGFLVIPAVLFTVPLFLGADLQAAREYGYDQNPIYYAFMLAAIPEEGFKLLAFMLLIWRSKHFNELFDGILYAAMISLGFAAIENLMYVSKGGMTVGVVRAFTSVPAHFLFGVCMGFHLGLAKFTKYRIGNIFFAFAYPVMLHGIYNSVAFSGHELGLLIILAFMVFAWFVGLKQMQVHSVQSVFRKRKRAS